MKNLGVLSCNIHCNFTNYGSALQSWALTRVLEQIGKESFKPILIDYCPPSHIKYDPLNPMKNMWDKDIDSLQECKKSLPAIVENYYKFDRFYKTQFRLTRQSYTSDDYGTICEKEDINAFVCGSDTIFCTEEFKGFDEAYFANYDCMRDHAISYGASFGDSRFDENTYPILLAKLKNFKAVGLRENNEIAYLQSKLEIPCVHNIDPTLLLSGNDYSAIVAERMIEDEYILLYSRRFNPQMFQYADELAKEFSCKVVNVSLRPSYNPNHIMQYGAGVEEFLSLVKNAKHVVTNSYHGLIFSYQFKRPYTIFTRKQAGNKIKALQALLASDGIAPLKENSLLFLQESLKLIV